MGTAQSSYTKDDVKVLAGELFTEELWQEFSSNGEMSRQQLFILKNTLSYSQLLKYKPGAPELITAEGTLNDKTIAKEGYPAIDTKLLRLSGEETKLSDYFSADKLLVLNIGSCT